ncbi:Uncharacterized protein APZ42_027552 [Daphnia magna]|uniref:Uncharacterized protein n=1 Tax=Daphnia magna TaxID=35525 RepID=A0A164R968_9CRUS|nr:Uncharacterized protein APZ42_027552 [Daphnia magna]
MDQCLKATANALERSVICPTEKKKRKGREIYIFQTAVFYDRKENIQKTLLVHDNRELADIVREFEKKKKIENFKCFSFDGCDGSG